jgi:hypothetical protein
MVVVVGQMGDVNVSNLMLLFFLSVYAMMGTSLFDKVFFL